MLHIRKRLLLIAAVLVFALVAVITIREEGEISAATIERRVAFVKELGYLPNVSSESVREVTIPYEFGDVYEAYNRLQREAGFDLSKYRGKDVKIYSYELLEYESDGGTVFINLITYKGTLIGGDICSASLNGFMRSLTKSSQMN